MRRPSSRSAPFYGWIIAGVLGLFGAVGVGLGVNFALFIEPISRDLGWSASTFGWALSLRLLMLLAAGPVIGRIIDVRGPRIPVIGGVLVAGALTLWLSRLAEPWELILVFILMGLVGMGRANDLQASASIAKWFVRRRGAAMGIALAGTPLGVVVYYPLTQTLIERIGWRDAFTVLALSGMAIVVPLGLLLRRQPEDMGLLPDGEPFGAESAARASIRERPSFTRREAMRTRTFWLMLAGFTAMAYGMSTLSIFRVPHFIERGLSPTIIALSIASDAIVAVIVSVVLGRSLDRLPHRGVLMAGLAVGMLCAVALIRVDGLFWLFTANFCYAIGFQSGYVAQSLIWAGRFGRVHQGDLQGFTIPVTAGIGALAFPVTGYLRDLTGAYTPAWAVAIGSLALAGVLLLAANPHPQLPRTSPRSGSSSTLHK